MNPYAAVALTAALLTAASAPRTAASNVLSPPQSRVVPVFRRA